MAIFKNFVEYMGKRSEQKNIKEMQAAISSVTSQKLEKIMTRDVITVNDKEPVTNIINIMVRKNISCVVVMELGMPVGLVTERDILMKLPLEQEQVANMKAKDIMSKGVISATPDTTIFEATEVMVKNHFRKLPIIKDEDEQELVGLITQTDLVRAFDVFHTKILIETQDLLTVRNIMSKNVETATKNTKFVEARQRMKEKKIGCILIIDEGNKTDGIFTEKNFIEQLSLNILRLNLLDIGNIMVYPIVTIDPELNLFEANDLMISKNFRRLPVAYGDNLLGIVTQTDILRAIHDFISITMRKLSKRKVEAIDMEENIDKAIGSDDPYEKLFEKDTPAS